jgi:hypothetical protein
MPTAGIPLPLGIAAFWARRNPPKIGQRLASDSTEAEEHSAFFLVVRVSHAAAELMAACPECGAITSFSLELAWRLGAVSCSECHLLMQLGNDDIAALRERLIEARMRINGLAAR